MADIFAEMLTENTGKHFLDSGGSTGRAWQKNKERDFEQEPEAWLDFSKHGEHNYLEYTKNIYWFLRNRLELNEDWDREFHAFVDSLDEDRAWNGYRCAAEDWLELLSEQGAIDGHGPYGESDEPWSVNSYNGEDLLSQVILYHLFEREGCEAYILQVHGGADVRGGYTKPRVFEANGNYELALLDNARGTIGCPKCEANWYTDDGYHWYYDGGGSNDLPEREWIVEEDGVIFTPEVSDDKLWITEDGAAWCPCCAKAKLEAYD